MSNLNIQFVDGNKFEYFDCDGTSYSGCPTCDYGSEYINDIYISTTNFNISIELNQMYEYAFSASEAISMFCNADLKSMTEKEFIDFLDKEFHEFGDSLKKFKVTERK